MKRRINLKAVLILAASLALLGGSVYFLHAFQVKRNARDLLELADEAERQGQTEAAADFLSQYLGLAPRDVDALVRCGTLNDQLAKTGRGRYEALLVLEKALRLDPSREDVRRRAARIALAVGLFGPANDHLEILRKDHPEELEVLELSGRTAAGLGRFTEAAGYFEQAVKLAPQKVELALACALLLRHDLKKTEAADEVIAALVRANELSLPARLAAARYYQKAGLGSQAEEQVRFALEKLAPDDAEALLLAASLGLASGKIEEAQAHLERGLKQHPRDPRMLQGLAQLDLQGGRTQQARERLLASLDAAPSRPEELWGLADMLIAVEELDRAAAVIGRLREGGQAQAVEYLDARLLARKGQWGEARSLLEKLNAGRLRGSELVRFVNLLLAECYGRLGNPDQQLEAYRRALEQDPLWLPARQGLAATLATLGKPDLAIEEYRKVTPQAPGQRIELIRLLFQQNLQRPLAERRWTEVERVLEELAQSKPPVQGLPLLRAEVWAAQGRLDEARRLVETERDRDPKQVGPWLFLASLAERQGKPETVLPLLEEAEQKAGKRVEWPLARVRHFLRAQAANARDQLAQLEKSLDQYPEAESDILRASLAEAFAALGDGANAERLWTAFANHQPSNLGVRFQLFELAIQGGREEAAKEQIAALRRIEGPGGCLSAYGEAVCHAVRARAGDPRGLTEARRLLAYVGEQRPSWSRVPLLAAELDEIEGRTDRALENYQAAVERGEGRLRVIRKVLQLQFAQGRYAEAQALLNNLPEQAITSAGLGRLAAHLSLLSSSGEVGDPADPRQRALRLVRQSVAADSKDYQDHLWLGHIAAAAGQPAEAEKAFRRARELASTNPDTWGALLSFLARTDADRAKAEMAEARRQLPAEHLPLVLAQACEALGQLGEAETHYQAALKARPSEPAVLQAVATFYTRTGQPAKAEPPLRKLIDPQAKVPEAVVLRARRNLALVLAGARDYRLFQEALSLVEINQKTNPGSIDDRRTRAVVLATRTTHRREAIEQFNTLSADRSAMPESMRFLLAQLYEAEGDWPRARQHLLAVLAVHGKNPVYMAHYIRGLLRHRETDEAQVWVGRLAAVAPRAFTTIELRARALKQAGKESEAGDLLQRYAQEKDGRPDLAALVLDELGLAAQAEKLLRAQAAAAKTPDAEILLANHLARRNRLREALDLLEHAWQKAPPESVALASMAALRAGRGTEEHYRRVEGWLTTALPKNPKGVVPTMLAELYDQRGRHDEAITLYRQILRHDSRNVVALNNLACLLVLKGEEPAESLQLVQAAIDVAGPTPHLLDTRAMIYLKSGQPDQAARDLERALDQVPSAVHYFHLAQVHQRTKNRTAATQALAEARKMGMMAADLHPLEREAFYQFTP